MGKHILFGLVFLNAVNLSSHEASTGAFFQESENNLGNRGRNTPSIDAFFEDLEKGSALGFEEVFAAGTLRHLPTTFFLDPQKNAAEESSDLLTDSQEKLGGRRKEASETVLLVEGSVSSANSKVGEKEKPPTLRHAVSVTRSMQNPKLEGWDLVEEADVVECKWPTDLNAGVPNQ